MKEPGAHIVGIDDAFYRDGFNKVIGIVIAIIVAILLLAATGIYLYIQKPVPITFVVDKDWRISKPVAIDKPYLSNADVLQWAANAMSNVFHFSFVDYNDRLQQVNHYFTKSGWQVFLNQLNNLANYNTVQDQKMFVSGFLGGAPTIISQGLLTGRYAWWVQVPIDFTYIAENRATDEKIVTFQVLVVRVPTVNNLDGVGINNIIIANNSQTGVTNQ